MVLQTLATAVAKKEPAARARVPPGAPSRQEPTGSSGAAGRSRQPGVQGLPRSFTPTHAARSRRLGLGPSVLATAMKAAGALPRAGRDNAASEEAARHRHRFRNSSGTMASQSSTSYEVSRDLPPAPSHRGGSPGCGRRGQRDSHQHHAALYGARGEWCWGPAGAPLLWCLPSGTVRGWVAARFVFCFITGIAKSTGEGAGEGDAEGGR